jgi:hypothetical protein
MTSRIGLTRRCNEPLAAIIVIEIKPHKWGWKVFEAPGVEPVFRRRIRRSDMPKPERASAPVRFGSGSV